MKAIKVLAIVLLATFGFTAASAQMHHRHFRRHHMKHHMMHHRM